MRTRNSGETVAALGDDLRQMVQKAYCNLDSLAQEVLALNQLYKSIPIEMKCRCVDRECKTVADAVDIIERYEALLGESSQKKTSVRSVSYENYSENKLEMVFGKEVTLPLQAVIPTPCRETDIQEVNEYVEILQKRFQSAHEEARKSLKKSNSYQKRHYDLRAKKRSLHDGQAVWVYEPTRKVGVCHKLTSKWKGPYIVTKKIDDVNYIVKKYPKKPGKVFHIDRLIEYKGNNIPKWFKVTADSSK
ncbi:Hypothetical predicted protein [Mytilus galloprovincialis]|uniref:Integrase p58-like C-terminal domain-containing protein n=1 Tax=Mytilus galloprovincialis TaxID=29158 RepID=A0A8B6EHY4_MYTGA|nr:Hypothetical predicted protein [Mytilus galloprovincialis]